MYHLNVLGFPCARNTYNELGRMVPLSGIWDICHHERDRRGFKPDHLLLLRLCNLDLTDRNVVELPASLGTIFHSQRGIQYLDQPHVNGCVMESPKCGIT